MAYSIYRWTMEGIADSDYRIDLQRRSLLSFKSGKRKNTNMSNKSTIIVHRAKVNDEGIDKINMSGYVDLEIIKGTPMLINPDYIVYAVPGTALAILRAPTREPITGLTANCNVTKVKVLVNKEIVEFDVFEDVETIHKKCTGLAV